MSNNSRKHSSVNESITKDRPVIIYLLLVVTFIISLAFFDTYVLPSSKTTDIITSYSVRTSGGKNGTKPQTVSYHYFTQKGFAFSTVKNYIEENDIELEYSLLFKSVTKVKSKSNDYTNRLSNGLNINGIQFYFCLVLLLSIAISLRILLSKKGYTENAYYNIICFNGFMVAVCIYMTYLF
ncbi:hypothetical protein HNP37_000370 [Flavobacterium nitrogenifigens]|uniref:Uncharacterized protein n=2 Tax=Flavobacterium TaxID=237 RepID=A0A7W7ITN2_9FLAO|nr:MULTISPECIES: hypothetical protein [Flavobacterium]MBB4800331.1 hypothetical protein [Flavobacterium nitrogenifigens]MBB6385919.1 hypothetical protein [Flavobacterium notoginsengisoli]